MNAPLIGTLVLAALAAWLVPLGCYAYFRLAMMTVADLEAWWRGRRGRRGRRR